MRYRSLTDHPPARITDACFALLNVNVPSCPFIQANDGVTVDQTQSFFVGGE